MVLSGVPRKKSPVTPPGIDPETVRLVAQHLNHYATPVPRVAIVGADNLVADPPNAVRNCSKRGVTAGGISGRSASVIPLIDTFSVHECGPILRIYD